MNYFKSFSEKIKIAKIQDFENTAFDLFQFQAENNRIYRQYLRALGVSPETVSKISEIPFLPISFFKTHKVVTGNESNYNFAYTSSGTTGQVSSRHFIWSKDFYLEYAAKLFEAQYGPLVDYHVLALLPAYLERPGSSLVEMVRYFIQKSGSADSGFYLYNHGDLVEKMQKLQNDTKKTLLIGVTFALLDLVENARFQTGFPDLLLMETGGMKGRRKEMIREEVHEILKGGLGVSHIHSEYGMTELMSQAYSKSDGIYTEPATMCVYIRDVYDPFQVAAKKSGAINIIDLANFHSCAFIETQDLGMKLEGGGFRVLGRMDNSEIRGCNLMVN